MKQITSLEEFNEKPRMIISAHADSDYLFLFTDEDEVVVIFNEIGISPISPAGYDNLEKTRNFLIAYRAQKLEKTASQAAERFSRLTKPEMTILRNILEISTHPEAKKAMQDVMRELRKREGEK